jgi:chromosome segregation ATPase
LGTEVEEAQQIKVLEKELQIREENRGELREHIKNLRRMNSLTKEELHVLNTEVISRRNLEKDLQTQIIKAETQLDIVIRGAAHKQGRIQVLENRLEIRDEECQEHLRDFQHIKNELVQEKRTKDQINNRLLEIYGSTAWRLIKLLWRWRVRLIPKGSSREGIIKSIISRFREIAR